MTNAPPAASAGDFPGPAGATRSDDGSRLATDGQLAEPGPEHRPDSVGKPATAESPHFVTVVGIGADGWAGLSAANRNAIQTAEIVLAGHRQQTLLPDQPGQERRRWPTPLLPSLDALLGEYAGRDVVVVAAGDPLESGVGSTLVATLGAERVRVLPALSPVALARARMGWAAETVETVTVDGRDAHGVLAALAPGVRLIVLSADGETPRIVAGLLTAAGYGASPVTVFSDLGSDRESLASYRARDWPSTRMPALNLICLLGESDGRTVLPRVGGLPDEIFEHDGQLTCRDVRAAVLARLIPVPGQLLWDVGAGAGSVAIEWARTNPRCRAVAVEKEYSQVERIRRNATALGVPSLEVVRGAAPHALTGLPRPDAVFVGGGATVPGLLDSCWDALNPGGRLVVHGVTLETEALLLQQFQERGGELIRLSVDRAEPVGAFTGWNPSRPVVQWSITKGS